MRVLYMVSLIIVILGALAWGLIGLSNFNLLAMFGANSWVTTLIYLLVGAAAIVVALFAAKVLSPGGESESRPEAANPPETGPTTPATPAAGKPRVGGTPAGTGPGSDPKQPPTTGAPGAGPGGTA